MKTIRTKLLICCMALFLTLGVLAGCNDTSTPAGTLQATLSAMKDGNFKQLSKLTGEDFEQGSWEGIPMQDMQRMFRAMFGNISVNVQEKESDGEHAVVTITGETGDLSSVMKDVGEETMSNFLKWCEDNNDRLLDITSEEMRQKILPMLVEAFENHKGNMTKKPVDVEIKMNKDSDGKWIVASESADDMASVVFGTDGIPSIESLLGNLT